ncbi:hypothetical protein LMH87_010427 [Akanthomyces muscarius]|uniref:Uncharacterized protein n=2 Tax=Akanthomyces TaxID=150366 RepID=A0A168GU20_CORDF|nr:hypothetical protein LMH87_010427 [Akanthomyces muscarius]KAJ4153962.1 hypothetical protein LMH87_010427 [Akanthomyces muscarius]OAA76921.1 hypothetical protein LEL_06605 [Akanthomyces lecanii RCEF 1005]
MASHITRRLFSTTTRRMADQSLKDESKRNPETMILGGVMVAALGGAGYYFGRNPTSSTSESSVHVTKGSAPWEAGGDEAKYKYHPGGDANAEPRDAPSAVNTVVVPNVTLTQEFHDKYNKWGKDGYP